MNSDTPVKLVTTMDGDSKADTYSSGDDMDDDMDVEPPQFYLAEKATHLLELVSIIISSDKLRRFSDAQIVVDVSLTDHYGTTFPIWDTTTCPCADGFMITVGTSERPFLLPKYFYLNLTIKDESRGTIIMMTSSLWRCRDGFIYDQEEYKCFDIARGFVRVCYTIFRYALFAFVNTKVIPNELEDDLHATVSGTIIATRKPWNGPVPRVLFNKRHCDKTILPSTGLLLSSSFPVPAYSSLKIHPKLKVNNEIIGSGEDVFEIEVFDNTYIPCKKVIRGAKWRIIMDVKMCYARSVYPQQLLAYGKKRITNRRLSLTNTVISDCKNSSMSGEESDELLDWNETSIVECGKVSAESENISKSEGIPENEEIQHGHQDKRLRTHRVETHCVEHPVPDRPFRRFAGFLPLVELFSISVCPYVRSPVVSSSMLLYGTITIADAMGNYDVFTRDKKDCAYLQPHEKIPLVDTRCYRGSHFVVELDLKDDGDRGREISKGVMSWDFFTVEGWYDRRISSVVQGKDGFAAIHYIMFLDAVQANLKVSITSKDGCTCKVRGKIWTRYVNQSYSTFCDKKYFRSVLFEREEKDPLDLCDGDVPLLKSVVPVPLDDVLVVELYLLRTVGCKHFPLKGKAFFNPLENKESDLIKGIGYDVTVSVGWG